MYEFGLIKLATGEQDIVFGYNINNAFKRANLNPEEYAVTYTVYVD